MYTQTAVESKVRLGLHRVRQGHEWNGSGEEDRISPRPHCWAIRERAGGGHRDSKSSAD